MGAEFTIEGTAFDTLGYDATHGQVLDLALEDATGLDAPRVVYSVVATSDGAPALTFSPSTGIPTTPTGTVTVTMPGSGVHSYRIQCQVNEGYDGNGRTNREYTKERIVAIRSTNLELRKLVPGETTQYSATGWTQQQNEAVDELDAIGGGSGTTEDVEATADTLALRGPDAEVKAAWIEAPIVRTTAGGDIAFNEGSTTFGRLRSTDACAQPGDLRFNATTGHPYAYIAGPGEVPLLGQTIRFHKSTADASDAATIAEFPIGEPPGYNWTITSVTFIPNDGLNADATNYATLRVGIYDSTGSLLGYAAIGVTTPSGSNHTGNWGGFVPVPLTLQAGFLAFPLTGTDYPAFSIAKASAGVTVPAGVLIVKIAPWAS